MKQRKVDIIVYTAIVTPKHIYIKGRVLRNRTYVNSEDDGPLSSLFKTFIRANSREFRNANLILQLYQSEINTKTDQEGYFEVTKEGIFGAEDQLNFSISLDYKGSSHRKDFKLNSYFGQVPYGIISDIDDTIMTSHVKSRFKIRLIINTLFVNPFRRKAIKNAAQLYHQIKGTTEQNTPIVYISNSPWNIHDYIQDFIKHNNFPCGELILRDFGVDLLRNKKSIIEQNKFKEVSKVLELFPSTKFTLIGDSAEIDFQIYIKIAELHPERIKEIIIIKAGNPKNEEYIENTIVQQNHQFISLIENYQDLISESKKIK